MPRKKASKSVSKEEKKTKKVEEKKVEQKAEPKAETKPVQKVAKAKKHSTVFAWIAAGLLLVFLVVLFVFAQNSISKVKQGKKEIESQTRVLKSTVNTLQEEIGSLQQKTNKLESDTQKSNEFLFNEEIDKRKLPDSVDTKDWQFYKDEEWKMEIVYAQNWQLVQKVEPLPAEGEQKAETRKELVLEPIEQSEFIRAMQIMPYDFGQELSMDDKIKSFESRGIFDTQDFNGGKLVYFIDKTNDLFVPTVMILSDAGNYKAIFRVNNLYHNLYFNFLGDFEAMMAVLKIEVVLPPAEEQPAAEEQLTE